MKDNLYGSAGNAALNPKTFMLFAIKKVILNNDNIIKFHKEETDKNELDKKIRIRLMNSVALLNEMKVRLNTEEENPAVESVMIAFDWIIKEMDEIEDIPTEQLELLEKKIDDVNYILKNIYEGFKAIE